MNASAALTHLYHSRALKKHYIGFGLVLTILIGISVQSYLSSGVVFDKITLRAQTQRRLTLLRKTLADIQEAETAQRGFLLTGKSSYLAPYYSVVKGIPNTLKDLKLAFVLNPDQLANVEGVEPIILDKLRELSETIRLRQFQGLGSALRVVKTDLGHDLMTKIRKTLRDLEESELAHLVQQIKDVEQSQRLSNTITVTGNSVAFALVVLAVFLMNRDTRRRLLAEEERDQFFVCSLDLLCTAGMDGYFKRLNPAFEQLLGFTNEELMTKPFLAYVHPGDQEITLKEVAKLSQGVPTISFENRYLCKDGSYKWLSWKSSPVGNIFYAAARDITLFKQTQAALQESERRLNVALEATHMGTWQWDLVNDTFSRSENHDRVFGFPSNLPHWNFQVLAGLIHEDDQSFFKTSVAKSVSEGSDFHVDCRIIWPDGSIHWINIRGHSQRDPNGRATSIIGIVMDLTDRKEAEEKLRLSEGQLTQAQHVARVGSWSVLLSTGKSDWSDEFYKIMGFNRKAIQANYPLFLETVHPEDRPAFQKIAEDSLEIGRTGELEHRIVRPGGSVRFVFSTCQAILDNARKPVQLFGTIQDITERKQIEQDLIQAREAAVESSRMKSLFLANMSHEIRTPMNAIIGMAELLADTPLNEEQRKYVETFRRSGDTLLTLINDILDISKIEAGDLSVEDIDFNLIDVVEAVSELMAPRAHDKGLEIAAHVHPDVVTAIIGDPHRLRQILLNLLGNAIKFTHQGEVLLTVASSPPGKGTVEFLFTVSDTGIGIPKDKLDSLFERFSQVDPSITRKYGGTGLGLSISKQLVELMGGRIGVESVEKEGSRFSFVVPFKVSTQPQAKIKDLDPSALQKKKVLIVDDNATNRMILRETLISWGALVTEAKNGKDGIREVRAARTKNEPFQLVLLDYRMPEMSGLDMAAEIKNEIQLTGLIMMMLTSDSIWSASQRAKELGVTGHLIKPVKRFDLWKAISAAFGKNSFPPEEIDRDQDRPSVPLNPIDDQRPLRILLVDDSEDNRVLILNYLKKMPYQIELAENGQVALDLFKTKSFDLVLMDMQMPIMDGYTATREMRSWEAQTQRSATLTPIIALTAYALKEEVEKSKQAGCSFHLAKPIKKLVLIRTILEQTSQTPLKAVS